MQKFLNPEKVISPVAEPKFLVRTSGPEELRWSGIGPASIGITELPRGIPIRVKPIGFRSPSADGSNKVAGSKNPNVRMGTKTPDEIFNDIRREWPNFAWYLFTTRDEALTFCETGKTDWQVLGVKPGSTATEIRKAYLEKSKQNHPDIGGDTQIFQQITTAYKRLTKLVASLNN